MSRSVLPELDQLSAQKIGTLVGVAPLNRDSRQVRGKCTVFGDRAAVRQMLYMATLVAISGLSPNCVCDVDGQIVYNYRIQTCITPANLIDEAAFSIKTPMKTTHFLIISVLMFGCSSIQNSELKSSPASSNLQTNAVPTPSSTISPQGSSSKSEDAGIVIQSYYDAINRHDYEQAYRSWRGKGSASHQTFEAFKKGFANTASTQVKIGELGPGGGAAGSQYIRVPVTVTATTQNQEVQHFKGTYILRRSLVDGASADERSWHIYSAKLVQAE